MTTRRPRLVISLISFREIPWQSRFPSLSEWLEVVFFLDPLPLSHKTNVVGTLNMLGLAKRVGARFLLTSTSEVYGDPLQHPQVETYWGNVNPIGKSFAVFSRSSATSAAWRYGLRRSARSSAMDDHLLCIDRSSYGRERRTSLTLP